MKERRVWLLIEDNLITDKVRILGYYDDENVKYAKEWVKKKGSSCCEYFLIEAIWLDRGTERNLPSPKEWKIHTGAIE